MIACKKFCRICLPLSLRTSFQAARVLGTTSPEPPLRSAGANSGRKAVGGSGGRTSRELDWKAPLTRWLEHRRRAVPEDGLVYFREVARCSVGNGREVLRHRGYRSLRQFIVQHLPSFHVEDVAQILLSCAKFKLRDEDILLSLMSRLQECSVDSLPDRLVGLVPWSLYRLNCDQSYGLFIESCTQEVIQRLSSKRFRNHEALGKFCWLLASRKRLPAKLTALVTDYMDEHIDSFSPDVLANLLWSMQKTNRADKTMFSKTIGVFRAHLSSAREGSYKKLLWCLRDKKHYDKSFFDAMAEKVLSGGFEHSNNPHFLCDLVCSCTTAKYYHAPLMDHTSRTVLPELYKLPPLSRVMLAYSFSFINHIDKRLLEEVARTLVGYHYLIPSDMIRLAWACLVADVYPREFFEQLLAHIRLEKPYKSRTALGQLDVATRVEHPELGFPAVPLFHLTRVMDRVLMYPRRRVTPFQQNVMDALQYVFKQDRTSLRYDVATLQGYTIDAELLLDSHNQPVQYEPLVLEVAKLCFVCSGQQGLDQRCLHGRFELLQRSFSLSSRGRRQDWESCYVASDWELELPSSVARKIAIEADGPQHFSTNCPRHPLGRSVLKQRQLKALGWELIKIPHFEWDPLRTSQNHVIYIKKKLF